MKAFFLKFQSSYLNLMFLNSATPESWALNIALHFLANFLFHVCNFDDFSTDSFLNEPDALSLELLTEMLVFFSFQ